MTQVGWPCRQFKGELVSMRAVLTGAGTRSLAPYAKSTRARAGQGHAAASEHRPWPGRAFVLRLPHEGWGSCGR